MHYFFVSEDEFDRRVAAGSMLEWAAFSGYRYGTPRDAVDERLQAGDYVLLEIELAGARQVSAVMPEATLVFLAPPSWDVLAARLSGRGTDDQEVVARRLERARVELAAADEFDVVLINDDVKEVCQRLVALIHTAGSAAGS